MMFHVFVVFVNSHHDHSILQAKPMTAHFLDPVIDKTWPKKTSQRCSGRCFRENPWEFSIDNRNFQAAAAAELPKLLKDASNLGAFH